jgi:hypothetical protein
LKFSLEIPFSGWILDRKIGILIGIPDEKAAGFTIAILL